MKIVLRFVYSRWIFLLQELWQNLTFKFTFSMIFYGILCVETGISCYPLKRESENHKTDIHTYMKNIKYGCQKLKQKENLDVSSILAKSAIKQISSSNFSASFFFFFQNTVHSTKTTKETHHYFFQYTNFPPPLIEFYLSHVHPAIVAI